jgi:hypothetical protein
VPEVLEVHDNAITPIRWATDSAHRLSISTDGVRAFDERTLMGRLAAMPGKEHIRAIYVAPGSGLTNCGFLKHFAGVTALTLASPRMESTAGLRFAPGLSDLILGTDQPNRIDLAELPDSSISRVRIERPRPADLQAIGRCTRLRRLEVVNAGAIDFRVFANLQLETLWLSQCPAFTRFSGTLSRLTTLRVTKCWQPFDLTLLNQLPELEDVSFASCKLVLDGTQKIRAPMLRKFWAGSVKNDVVNQISRALPSTLVSNGSVLEIGGVRQPDVQAFHEQ